MNTLRSASGQRLLRYAEAFPWVKGTSPFIVGAPMRVMSGPDLALAVSKAGGLGFIGPGEKPDDSIRDLAKAQELLRGIPPATLPASISSSSKLPVGVGFQLWNGDLASASRAVKDYQPCAAWLFAPRNGQADLDEWSNRLREAAPGIHIWIQIGTLQEALEISKSNSRPEALVIQGAEAGGHGRATDGLGIVALLPEIADAVRDSGMALIAAGGIADGRGVAAALALGADGVAMGTRFLAATEARISKGYQQEVVRAADGATSTTRTMLYNHLRGTFGWPEQYSPRGVINQSYRDHQAGVEFDELKRRHDEAKQAGDAGWGPDGRLATYAGAAVGLIHGVEDAGAIVGRLQREAGEIVNRLAQNVSQTV
ncbi:2-nitropropane dioxygenase precursor [Paramyrothecium foliicola]|nr:2-nitropropane dioxygenase precursor [Paramyrothecium foliicola]